MAEIVQKPVRSVYKDGSIVVSNVKSKIDNTTTSYSVVNLWYDGTPMNDSKVDQFGIYSKYKPTGEYLRENKPQWGELFLEVDTVEQLRAMTPYNQFLIWIGYYKGVRLGGYYIKGDTPGAIDYFLSSTSQDDDGGSVFIVGNLKFIHDFGGYIDVRYFGAFPNVKELDEINTTETEQDNVTRKIQNSLNLGGKIYVPVGRYYINYSQGLFISKDGTEISGVYGKSIFVAGKRSRRANGYHFRTLNVVDFERLNVENVILRNIAFERIAEDWIDEFDQFYHHINIAGASQLLIERLMFYGCLGDAICIGGHNSLNEELNAKVHNKNISLFDCLIDGRNNENRNAVSIIDGDNVQVRRNQIYNFTRDDMPGAIDVEPNLESDYIIKNIFIEENQFYNVGGMAGIIGCYGSNQGKTIEPHNIFIRNNRALKGGVKKNRFGLFCDFKATTKDSSANTPLNNIVIEGNKFEEDVCENLFLFYGVKGLSLRNNEFSDFEKGGFISFASSDPESLYVVDVTIDGNLFQNGKSSPCIRLSYANGVKISNNRFTDASTSSIIDISGGTDLKNVSILGNTFENVNHSAKYYLHYGYSPENVVDLDSFYIGGNSVVGDLISNLKINRNGAPSVHKRTDIVYSGNADFGDISVFSPQSVAEVNRSINSRVLVALKSDSSDSNVLWRDLQLVKIAQTGNLPSSNAVNGEMIFDTTVERPKWFFNGGWRDLLIPSSPANYGRVKQSIAVNNVSSPDASDLPTALTLINEIKIKFNGKLKADRDSGQQSTI
jgi:hypothetical protein